MKIIARDWRGLLVGQQQHNGYVNVTQLCKAYFEATGVRREPYKWVNSQRAQESIAYLSTVTQICVDDLVVVKQGGFHGNEVMEQGTWVHPKLATGFAMWLSVELEFIVLGWVEDWLLHGKSPIANNVYLTGQEFADECIADKPVTPDPKYTRDFAREVNRVWHNKESDKFAGLQHFINKFVYDRYPWEARFKIDLNRAMTKCKATKHSYFRDGIPTDLLEDALGKITCLLEHCDSGNHVQFMQVYCDAMTDDEFWKIRKNEIVKASQSYG